MRVVLHFLVLAGSVLGAIQLTELVMDAIGVTLEPGFGVDDLLQALFVALGVSLTMTVAKSLLKAA